jgi:hypothetical protein
LHREIDGKNEEILRLKEEGAKTRSTLTEDINHLRREIALASENADNAK